MFKTKIKSKSLKIFEKFMKTANCTKICPYTLGLMMELSIQQLNTMPRTWQKPAIISKILEIKAPKNAEVSPHAKQLKKKKNQ